MRKTKENAETTVVQDEKERIIDVEYADVMQESYIDYAMSVIVARALPDVRDGLKPVQRRIMYDMKVLGTTSDKPFRKSARIVGDTMGKFHPHGDCLDGDVRIRLLDGTTKTMRQLYEEQDSQWVLSIDERTNEIVPAKAHSFRIGQRTRTIYKIRLANGFEIRATSNHPFRLTNGKWVKAEDVREHMILDFVNFDFRNDRPFVGAPLKNRTTTNLAKLVAERFSSNEKEIVHHVDGNPMNNVPENLVKMTREEHATIHRNYLSGLSLGRERMFDVDGEFYEKTRRKNSKLAKEINRQIGIIKAVHCLDLLKSKNVPLTYENYESLRDEIYNLTKIETLTANGYFENFDEFVERYMKGERFYEIRYEKDAEEKLPNERDGFRNRKNRRYVPNKMILKPVIREYEKLEYGSKPPFNSFKNTTGKLNVEKHFDEKEFDRYVNENLPIVKSVEIERTNDEVPMYDFTVDDFHNMLICASEDESLLVVAHNSSIYGAMTVLAQDFKMEVPLVDGHGNFGSIEGDGQAAMRYTEARLRPFAETTLLADLDKNVVDFVPNYDESEKEPEILPARIPLFLVNGSEGIAVGMTTSAPPHNLGEIVDAETALIKKPNVTTEKLLEIVEGPDFPTGGIVANKDDLPAIYETGTGKLRLRGRIEVEKAPSGKSRLVVTEIPYTMVGMNIGKFLNDVAALVESRVLSDVSDISNQTSKDGVRIVLELKKDADVQSVIATLYSKTKLEDTFGVNMLAIVDGRPEILGLKEALQKSVDFQYELNERKYVTLLEQAKKRREIQEGLIKACDCIDLIIEILRGSKDRKQAKACMVEGKTDGIKFRTKKSEKDASKLLFTEAQADAILDMRLHRLIGLELEALKKELAETLKEIDFCEDVLGNRDSMSKLIVRELNDLKKKYATPRKTTIENAKPAVMKQVKAKDEKLVVLLDKFGYLHSIDATTYDRNSDAVAESFVRAIPCMSSGKVFVISDKGKSHVLPAREIPYGKLRDKGTPIDVLSGFDSKTETIVSRRTTAATKLLDGDEILKVLAFGGQETVVLTTENGYALRFRTDKISSMKKTSVGVGGIALTKGDSVADMLLLEKDGTAETTVAGNPVEASSLRIAGRNTRGTKF